MKKQTITRDEQAARLVKAMIEADGIVKAEGPQGSYTVGPAPKAAGPSTFGLYGYGRDVPEPYRAREGQPIDVARAFVACVGSGRAREAALRTPGRPALSDAAAQIARQKAEHIRTCRAVRCRTCGA